MNLDNERAAESAFWQFSLALYARPGVGDACIELQERAHVDVNVLLYLLFLASRKVQIDLDAVSRIDATVAGWRDQIVSPLRTLRRALKTGVAPCPVGESVPLRSTIKRVELDAEHLQQNMLARLAFTFATQPSAQSTVAIARANLHAYGTLLNGLPQAAVETIIAAFDESLS